MDAAGKRPALTVTVPPTGQAASDGMLPDARYCTASASSSPRRALPESKRYFAEGGAPAAVPREDGQA